MSHSTAPLRVAACQFAVSDRIDRNLGFICRQVDAAASRQADVVHFPECALSGYGSDVLKNVAWDELRSAVGAVMCAAKARGVWVVMGTYHLPPRCRKPFNSVLLISPEGEIAARYDKRKLYGKEQRMGLCQPGRRNLVFDIDGHRCGFLICQDSCYPALYEEYRRESVTLVFDSLYNAGNPGGATSLDRLIDAQLRSRAADYGVWISAANSSARHSRLASSVFRPDGSRRSLKRHVAGIICHDFPDDDLGWTYDNRA